MRKSPAQVYALVFGVALTLAGILGFFYSTDFSSGAAATAPGNRDAVLGILDVNGWHNVVHLLSGLVGLAVVGSWAASRLYALTFGIVYLAVTAIGFALGAGHAIFGLIPVNTDDNVLHLAIALLGILAGLLTSTSPPPTTVQGEGSSRAFEASIRRHPSAKMPPTRQT